MCVVFPCVIFYLVYLQLVEKENVRGIVSLTEEYEMKDFVNTEKV